MSNVATKMIPFARPSVTDAEKQAVMRVLDSPILTHGPECKGFEEDFAAFIGEGTHALAVSSCMAALHLSYLHFRIGEGDEVIVPAQTHTATAHAVEWVGAKPVFVDCDPRTGNMTPEAIRAAVTSKTKAIGLVHYIGIPCDMPAIMQIAAEHGLKVIEDCALAVGARIDRTHVGMWGDAGCFSFYPVKHMTSGEGGMFITRHEDVAASVRYLRAFGVDRTHQERKVPGMYDVPRLGLNYRMSELQAALGRVQVARLPEFLKARAKNFSLLNKCLSGFEGIAVVDTTQAQLENSYYCLVMILGGPFKNKRDASIDFLKQNGVGTSIYYPQPVPRMSYYARKYGYAAERYAGAEAISDEGIALPVGPHLSDDDLNYLIEILNRWREEFAG